MPIGLVVVVVVIFRLLPQGNLKRAKRKAIWPATVLDHRTEQGKAAVVALTLCETQWGNKTTYCVTQ